MSMTGALIGIVIAVVIGVTMIPIIVGVADQAGLEPPEETEAVTTPPVPAPEFTDTGEDASAGLGGGWLAIQMVAAAIAVGLGIYKFTGLWGRLFSRGDTDEPALLAGKRKAKLSILGIRIR